MRTLLLLPLIAALAGCASDPAPRVGLEDQTRRVAPLPACVLRLPARGARSQGTLRGLRETEIVKLLVPGFDEDKRLLPGTEATCVGEVAGVAAGEPLHPKGREEDGDVLFGAGGDRIKVAWLRSRAFADGSVGGPLALVRGREEMAEAFAVGSYRGNADRVTLGAERAGGRILVTAEDDGCSGRARGEACATLLSVFVSRRGRLEHVVDAPTLRVAYADHGEPGVRGTIEYRLTTTASYGEDGIHLSEQLDVRTGSGESVRKVERERLFSFSEAGALRSTTPSLWDEVAALR